MDVHINNCEVFTLEGFGFLGIGIKIYSSQPVGIISEEYALFRIHLIWVNKTIYIDPTNKVHDLWVHVIWAQAFVTFK